VSEVVSSQHHRDRSTISKDSSLEELDRLSELAAD
jgi:hypothetical protein